MYGSYYVVVFSICIQFIEVFIMNGYWILSTNFSPFIERNMIFILLMCITWIDLGRLSHPCLPGILFSWSLCMIFLIKCWVQFVVILLKTCTSVFIKNKYYFLSLLCPCLVLVLEQYWLCLEAFRVLWKDFPLRRPSTGHSPKRLCVHLGAWSQSPVSGPDLDLCLRGMSEEVPLQELAGGGGGVWWSVDLTSSGSCVLHAWLHVSCACPGTARALAMGHCRLCHGKFSSRSLRSISGRAPGESSERPPPGDRVFIRDFQRLLGVAVHQDPALSQFVCKNCHAQFYQCHGLLTSFLQRVNVPPTGRRKPCTK